MKDIYLAREGIPKLWHCADSRSLRPLWLLEEMGVEYDIEVMKFPPRFTRDGYKDINILGTVPYFVDGETHMTESSGICHYLVEKYQAKELSLAPQDKEYGSYLNWLYQSDATLTFPQTVVLRYSLLESGDRQLPQAVEDYTQWFYARLRMLNQHLEEREYLCDDRFTIADIAIAFALILGELLGLSKEYKPQTKAYLERLKQRPAFKKANAIGAEESVFRN